MKKLIKIRLSPEGQKTFGKKRPWLALQADVVRGLAIHKFHREGWRITHVGTGRRVFTSMSRKEAVAARRVLLLAVKDWTTTADEIRGPLQAEAAKHLSASQCAELIVYNAPRAAS